MELYQRTSTEQPGMATLESTVYHPSRNDLQDISLGEERSLDSAGDGKRIFLAENSVSYQNPSVAKRGSLFPDGLEEPSIIRQQNDDSVLSQIEHDKPNSPDYANKERHSPPISKAVTRQTARHGTRRNFNSQYRTETAQSIDRR